MDNSKRNWIEEFGIKRGKILEKHEPNFKKIFDRFDKNKDGYIDIEEANELKMIMEKVTGEAIDVEDEFNHFDKNNDGKISWSEWRDVHLGEMASQVNEDQYLFLDCVLETFTMIFTRIDAKPLPREEFVKICEPYLIEWFNAIDENGDGFLTLQEYKEASERAKDLWSTMEFESIEDVENKFSQLDLNNDKGRKYLLLLPNLEVSLQEFIKVEGNEKIKKAKIIQPIEQFATLASLKLCINQYKKK